MIEKILEKRYGEWFRIRSDEETAIQIRAIEFEEKYFTDMTLLDYEKDIVSEIETEDGVSQLDQEKNISINNWRFKINPNIEDGDAITRNYEYLIEFKPEFNDDNTLLHEMIHAYEFMLKGAEMDNYVTIRLYEELLLKIPNLLEFKNKDINLANKTHTTLFLLKSLKLDIELGQELGTVYAYNREDLFSGMANPTI